MTCASPPGCATPPRPPGRRSGFLHPPMTRALASGVSRMTRHSEFAQPHAVALLERPARRLPAQPVTVGRNRMLKTVWAFAAIVPAFAVMGERLHAGQHPKQDIEDRREEQAENSHADHPGEHRNAHHPAHLRAGAGGQHQRHHAHDEGHRCHQDRAQPQIGWLQWPLEPAKRPANSSSAGELDDQDRVLGGKPDQNDQADLGKDVIVAVGEPDAEHRG